MNICIIGNSGNMGSRYQKKIESIVSTQPIHITGYEIDDFNNKKPLPIANKFLVCTPTNSHYEVLKFVMDQSRAPILCEKPISKNINEVMELCDIAQNKKIRLNMVNNWSLVTIPPLERNRNCIYYSCSNTGKDGLPYDLIQLLHLAHDWNFYFTNKAPEGAFNVHINQDLDITREIIELSYNRMLQFWIEDRWKYMWDVNDIRLAHKKVLKYIPRYDEQEIQENRMDEDEINNHCTSQERLYKIKGQVQG